MRGRQAVLTFALTSMLIVAACGGGGGSSPTPTPTGGGGGGTPTASDPGASNGPVATGGGTGSPGGLTIPAAACSVVSDADIKNLFGGEVEPVPNDDPEANSCSFSVTKATGLLKDYAATTPQVVAVTFDDGYIGYDEEHAAMGEAVTKVDGLGSEAWLGLGAIHVDLGHENELVVSTVFGAIYDQAVIANERYLLAKLVLSRL